MGRGKNTVAIATMYSHSAQITELTWRRKEKHGEGNSHGKRTELIIHGGIRKLGDTMQQSFCFPCNNIAVTVALQREKWHDFAGHIHQVYVTWAY